MKRPSPWIRRGSDTDMNSTMTPMIDVVFLLLVFFVWTASFQIVEQILPTQLSSQMGSEAAEPVEPTPENDIEDIVIRVAWDGQTATWKINENPPLDSLDSVQTALVALADLQSGDKPIQVILYPEPVVPLGPIIDVYDIAKLSGFPEISFAVTPGKSSP